MYTHIHDAYRIENKRYITRIVVFVAIKYHLFESLCCLHSVTISVASLATVLTTRPTKTTFRGMLSMTVYHIMKITIYLYKLAK